MKLKTKRLTAQQAAWLAGWLEGEGHFQNLKKEYAPRIKAGATDEDVVRKAAVLLNGKVYGPYQTRGKPIWFADLRGLEAVTKLVELFSLMGTRRRERMEKLLNKWEHQGGRDRAGQMAHARKFRHGS